MLETDSTIKSGESFIRLEGVTIRIAIHNPDTLSLRKAIFGQGQPKQVVTVLDGIDLEVKESQKIGIFGPNGSGKTSLLRCIVGGYKPRSGRVTVSGRINSFIDIGLGLDPEASGRANISLKLGLYSAALARDEEMIQSIIEYSGLGEAIDLPIRTYSSGMTMRLAFSIISSVDSDILLMDEWLSVGDTEFNERAQQRLSDKLSNNSILVLASHNMGLLESTCETIYMLEKGRIVNQV